MDKLKLKNNREIAIEYGSTGSQFQLVMTGLADLQSLVDNLTTANMERIEVISVVDATEQITGVLEDKRLAAADPITLNPIADTGNWRIMVRMGDVDQLEKRLAQLEATQNVQDGAIDELGQLVSGVVESEVTA